MPYYNVFFETTQGELQYKVPIGEDSNISAVLPALLKELQEKGYRLSGETIDSVQVLWNGQTVRQDIPLAEQGVRPLDNLRIRTQPPQQSRLPQPAIFRGRTQSSGEGSLSLKLLYIIVAFLPIWIIEYLAVMSGSFVLSAVAALLGCGVALGLWYFAETGTRGPSELIPFATVLIALSTSIFAAQKSRGYDPAIWAMVSPALLVGIIGGFRIRKVSQLICGIGGEPFTGIEFACPRCGHTSCSTHWNTRRVRCTNCDQRDILWLSLQGAEWWDKRLGPPINEGQCARCRSGPESQNAIREQKDLRECGGCGMLQCRWCWDLSNGVCVDEQRCGWTMNDLPSAIATMSNRKTLRQGSH